MLAVAQAEQRNSSCHWPETMRLLYVARWFTNQLVDLNQLVLWLNKTWLNKARMILAMYAAQT